MDHPRSGSTAASPSQERRPRSGAAGAAAACLGGTVLVVLGAALRP